tara:strand:- start:90 stop:350 length:261 start_codon:yes stop_codon:yes gene_type:complete
VLVVVLVVVENASLVERTEAQVDQAAVPELMHVVVVLLLVEVVIHLQLVPLKGSQVVHLLMEVPVKQEPVVVVMVALVEQAHKLQA